MASSPLPSTPSLALRLLLIGGLLLGSSACGDDTVIAPNREIDFMVGEWEARSFLIRDREFPALSIDVVEDLGGRFRLFVEPSGRYTALLETTVPQAPESGRLYLEDGRLVLEPDIGEPAANEYTQVQGRVILRGESEFAFSSGGELVPVDLVIDLDPTG